LATGAHSEATMTMYIDDALPDAVHVLTRRR
jgi:hypothetical protein